MDSPEVDFPLPAASPEKDNVTKIYILFEIYIWFEIYILFEIYTLFEIYMLFEIYIKIKICNSLSCLHLISYETATKLCNQAAQALIVLYPPLTLSWTGTNLQILAISGENKDI